MHLLIKPITVSSVIAQLFDPLVQIVSTVITVINVFMQKLQRFTLLGRSLMLQDLLNERKEFYNVI